MTLVPGSILNDRYRILSILGQGGMGSVYRAEDINLGVAIAVKENLFLTQEYARQFEREARILANLRHPTLPRVGDYFIKEQQGQYLVMDYIEGEDLRQRLDRDCKIPANEVVYIGIAICDALTYMHSRNPPVLHRDIKPGNIKITPDGDISLVDFGLAKVMEGDQITITGARAMTPGYSPPEQYGTARTDPRSDIYSLGATLYAILTGNVPEDSLDRMTGKTDLTGVRDREPSINRKLCSAIERALELEPDDRFQTAEEFRKALQEAVNIEECTLPYRFTITPPPGYDRNTQSENDSIGRPPSTRRKFSSYTRRLMRSLRQVDVKRAAMIVIGATIITLITLALFRPGFESAANTPLPTATIAPSPTITLTATLTPPPPTTTPTPVILPTLTLTPTPTITLSPTSVLGYDQIAFASDRTGIFQVWVMKPDGKLQRQLTNQDDGACQPNWSPNGSRIAFTSPCKNKKGFYYENSRIFVMDADGKNQAPLPIPAAEGGDFDPTWSPDGKSIAFTSLRNKIAHIFVYNLETNTLLEFSDTRFADMQPVWHPGGKQIAFVRKMFFNHIWIMSDKGQTLFQMSSSGDVDDVFPVWTPDGEAILFSRSQNSPPSIPWLLSLMYEDRGTNKEKRIPPIGQPDPGPILHVSFSPNGQWIVYESWPDGRNHDIYLMDIKGSNLTRLTSDPGVDTGPVWRPAGP